MQEPICFVDIHTHILPGVDDGAPDMSRAIAMLQRAWEQGTGAVVLTPHYRGRFRDNVRSKLEPVYQQLVREAQKACPGMELYLGCEVGYEMDISEKLADGSVLCINGTRYVLLEFHDTAFRSMFLEGVLELLNFGYIPILAHVERYEAFYLHRTLARELVELGALLQINAESVIGKMGFGTKRFCRRLMRSRLVHFIGSDAHDEDLRPPELTLCFEKISRKYGRPYAQLLLGGNARTVLSGGENIECWTDGNV